MPAPNTSNESPSMYAGSLCPFWDYYHPYGNRRNSQQLRFPRWEASLPLITRIFLTTTLWCFCGFFGYVLYLLGGSNLPLHSAAHWLGYLLVWPIFAIQKLGGANPDHYGTTWDPVKTFSWIGLWLYYYLLIGVCDRCVRKR